MVNKSTAQQFIIYKIEKKKNLTVPNFLQKVFTNFLNLSFFKKIFEFTVN